MNTYENIKVLQIDMTNLTNMNVLS